MKRLWLIGGSILLLLAGISVYGFQRFESWRFELARQRWAARSFTEYRLEIERRISYPFSSRVEACRQILEISGTEVRQVVAGTCAPGVSVDAVFERFAPYVDRPVLWHRCGHGGCACAVTRVSAVYDRELGYPRLIERDWQDITPGSGRSWQWLMLNLPGPARGVAQELASWRNPCAAASRGMPRAALPSEYIEVIVLTPLARAP